MSIEISLAGERLEVELLAGLPLRFVLSRRLIPVGVADDAVILAAASRPAPADLVFLRRHYGMAIEPRLASEEEIELVCRVLERHVTRPRAPRKTRRIPRPAVTLTPLEPRSRREGWRWALVALGFLAGERPRSPPGAGR